MNLPYLNADLLVRPQPQEGESQWGFWLRIANENGLRRPQWLLAPGARWASGTVRFCPECLRAANPTWREDWEDPQSYWCSRHMTWLVDSCSSCHRRLQWNCVRFLECSCGHDLRDEDAVAIGERIRTCVGACAISLVELRILGVFALHGSIGKPGKKVNRTRLNEVRAQLQAGVDVIEDWPSNFVEALDRHRIGARAGVAQLLVEAFPRLHGFEKLIPAGVWRQRVQDAINSYCGESLSSSAPIVGRNAVLRAGPMTIKQAATRLGRRFESVASVIDQQGNGVRGKRVTAQGRLRRVVSEDDLVELGSLLMEPIETKKAARLMSLPVSRVCAMIRSGLLREVEGRLVRSQVLAIALPERAIQDASTTAQEDLVSVHVALRKWIRVEDTSAFIQALRNDGPRAIAVTATCPIGDWAISRFDAAAWAKMQRAKTREDLTLRDAAMALHLKYDVVRDLIRVGLLTARYESIGDRRSWYLTHADLETFKSRYVALVVLTRKAQVRSRNGLAWARRHSLRIVTGPDIDGSRQYFVDRSANAAVGWPALDQGMHRLSHRDHGKHVGH